MGHKLFDAAPSRLPSPWYLAICGATLLLVLSHTLNQRWQGDFWQHSACITEISLHPFSPGHPHLPVDQPHEFYSPYAVLLGWVGRALGIGAIALLSIMGIVNVCLFFFSLWLYTSLISQFRAAPAYALLFTLVLWGAYPLMFSGFFHLQMLGDVAPYPSFFSASLTLLAWSAYILITRGRSPALFLALAAIVCFVLLSHPPTAVTLNIGLLAIWLGSDRKTWRSTALLGAVLASQLLAAWAWPYYPFFQVTLQAPATHHLADVWCYVSLLRRYWPLALCAPALLGRMRRKRTDPIVVSLLMCLTIYIAGYATGKYAFGRNIAYVVFFAHIAAADWAAATGAALRQGMQPLSRCTKAAYYLLLAVACGFSVYYSGVAVYRYRPGRACTYAQFRFLRSPRYTGKVFLADLATARFIPSFGGKVVALDTYQRFIQDHSRRQSDVKFFFSPGANDEERRAILLKYRVDYVMLNLQLVKLDPATVTSLEGLCPPCYHSGPLTVIPAPPREGAGVADAPYGPKASATSSIRP